MQDTEYESRDTQDTRREAGESGVTSGRVMHVRG
jgi:hypothetical protein